MSDATLEVQTKMKEAGLSVAAIQAFLHQYQKLVVNESGLIPENSLTPIEDLPTVVEQPNPGDISSLTAETVVLKLNGGLGTGMGLERAKSLLGGRGDLTFLDVIVRQYLYLRSNIAPRLALIFMNSFSTSRDTADTLRHYPELGNPDSLELIQNKVPKIDVQS